MQMIETISFEVGIPSTKCLVNYTGERSFTDHQARVDGTVVEFIHTGT